MDASENPGQLVLLDKDGILGDGDNAKKADGYYVYDESWERDIYIADDLEWMTDPLVLKEFINYCVENFPAEKYDLILWDHGGGILGGFGYDDHDRIGNKVVGQTISYSDFIDVIADCAVVRNGGKFDFIDFDARLMNSIEFCLGLSDYADYYIASADSSPAFGQYYTGWLDAIGAEPDKDTYELGEIIVDDYKSFYENEDSDGLGRKATLGIVALQPFADSGILTEGKDYIWEKGNEEEIFRDAGTYEVLLTGVGDYLDVTLGFLIIQPAPIEETVISGIVDKTYTGKAISQSPVVKLGELTLEEGKDYTVSYENNIEIGTAFMTITGVGNITGEVTKTFRISAKTDETTVTPKSEQKTPTILPEDGSKKPTVSQKPAEMKVTHVIENAACEQVTGIPNHTTQSQSEKSVQSSTAKPASTGVKTGDDNPVSLWILLMLFSVGTISSATRSRRKNQG